ncbi:MAG: hypothetical protein LBJ00_11000 [Planctomycetaceae bacterium]|nr:hypothetical protein [Planctomycetaceae bacterium]
MKRLFKGEAYRLTGYGIADQKIESDPRLSLNNLRYLRAGFKRCYYAVLGNSHYVFCVPSCHFQGAKDNFRVDSIDYFNYNLWRFVFSHKKLSGGIAGHFVKF